MALLDNAFYISSVAYAALTKWSDHTAVAGEIIQPFTAQAVGSERVYVCIIAGATGATEPATWTATRGAKVVSSSATYQECTGIAALNGDLTNTPTWSNLTGDAAFAVTLGQVIKRNSGASIWICSTAGTSGTSEPAWPDNNAGSTRTDGAGTLVWTCLGASVGVLAAPHARLENALAATWGLAGNTFFIADNHTQTTASQLTLTFPATSAAPNNLVSFDHLVGSTPPTASVAGATINETGNAGILIGAFGTMEGVTFNGGTTAGTGAGLATSQTANNKIRYKNCTFALRNSSNVFIYVGGSTSTATGEVQFEGCTFTFAATTQSILVGGRALFRNCTASWSNMPTALCGAVGNDRPLDIVWEACDLSNYTGNIFSTPATNCLGSVVIKDCKIHASATFCTTPTASSIPGADWIRSDSGNTVYKIGRRRFEGDLTVDTTTVRTGGANDGTTSVSWKIATNAAGSGPSIAVPFDLPPLLIWNSTIAGNVNLTIYGAGASTPNIDDIWFDVEYLGDATSPKGSFATAGKDSVVGATSAWTTDSSSSWGGTPATQWYLTKQFAPRQIGYIYVYPKVAKAGQTYYIDPKPVLT